MADLLRLTFPLILGALTWLMSVFPVPARAGTPPTTQYQADWNGTLSALSATPEAACADAGQKRIDYSAQTYPENAPWTLYSTSYTAPSTCTAVYSNQYSGQVTATYSVATVQTCPDGQSLVNGECVNPVNGCTDLTGKSAGTYNGPAGSGPVLGPKQLCVTQVSSGDAAQPGCRATGEATFGYKSSEVGSIGDMYWQAQFAFTGEKCNPNASGSTDASGTTPSVPPAPGSSTGQTTQCPIGKVPGEVNGQTVCVTPGTDTPQQRKNDTGTTEQKADGTTVEKTTSKQTVCDATKCTTTTTTATTTTPPGGTASSTTETSTSTCVVGSPDCTAKAGVGGGGGGGGGAGAGDGESSSFGGSCAASFKCDGDAVMCAVALEQHKRDCALFVDSSPESNLYASEKTKTGAQYSSENVTISNSSFNSSNAFGGSAQCIQDKVITVWGSQVVLPFSQVCDTLAHLGTLLMTVSFLLAFRIVARG